MSISDKLVLLQNDIVNARTAITTMGGTVTENGGSSQLAADIATIPIGSTSLLHSVNDDVGETLGSAANSYEQPSTWLTKTWISKFSAEHVWSDGDNIYYSNGSSQYKLNKSTLTWNTKAWSGLTKFDGQYIWSDGNNIYYSESSDQYVLNKSTSVWSKKTWSKLTSFYGNYVWSDGDNIYYSYRSDQYILLKTPSYKAKLACKPSVRY